MNVIRSHSIVMKAARSEPLEIYTLLEVANELRCSKTHLYNILRGKVNGLPPPPVFHIGKKVFLRRSQLLAWIRSLEDIERENRYASGLYARSAEMDASYLSSVRIWARRGETKEVSS